MNEEERRVAERRFQNTLRQIDARRLNRTGRKFVPVVVILASVLLTLSLLVLQGGLQ